MRVNLRKLILAISIALFLWLLISYSSVIEVPRAISRRASAIEIENKIYNLEKQMEEQLADSNLLLQKVKQQIKKEDDILEDGNDGGEEKDIHSSQNVRTPVLPVLVIACDRITVKRCLNNLVKFRPSKETFPIIVSQDCGHKPTYQVIKSFTAVDPSITIIQQPDLSEIALSKASELKLKGYYKIARHFKFALSYVFETLGHEAVIIVEDDLDISPDFFEYFLGTYPLLVKDSSLWCISAWNDNGKKDVIDISHPELLHRTDFFPGLGWMLRREFWMKLAPKWPAAFFDDWLRNPENIEGKSCIRPEISRTYSFGKVGVSKGLFFDLHLRNIQLNQEFVEFTKLNLTYLLKENYDAQLSRTISSLPEMTAVEVMASFESAKAVKVSYYNAKSYQMAAKKLGLMDDFRSGVPRTAYRGVVSCFVRGKRVYLTPDFQWIKYDRKWG
ncbi:unnamed protein product [Arctia plantaginis]|uniref:Alpha-1,3-mannosyl-glycoprotein 2-beta-N-acetylglucosaminyltransferase n=1 Tax=Arctia plantaginis TaxID=874455 RepID=A0A8S1BX11_ARCPL|nr:unnamed protein product [Arctia plantaginis]